MAPVMKDSGLKVSLMERAGSTTITEINMMATGKIISAMGMGFIRTKRVRCTKEIGIMISKKAMGKKFGQLAQNMMELITKG